MSPKRHSQPTPRKERGVWCEKPGTCISNYGEPLYRCTDAPRYENYAAPASENICLRRAEATAIHRSDPYKHAYLEQSRALDCALADPTLTPERLSERFRSIEAGLERLIDVDEDYLETSGRLIFHIDARLLYASLGVYYHRATRSRAPLSQDIMTRTHQNYVEILADFYDGLYADHAIEVASKRTEIEVITLLSRTSQVYDFPIPALFREEGSETRAFNHDLATYSTRDGKTPIQVKTTSYLTKSLSYSPEVVMVIHNDLVRLGHQEGELIVQTIEPRTSDDDDGIFTIPYEEFDTEIGVRWYASPSARQPEEPLDEPVEFIQRIDKGRPDALISAIVNEARGEHLTLDDRNLLNAASHYLIAALRQSRC